MVTALRLISPEDSGEDDLRSDITLSLSLSISELKELFAFQHPHSTRATPTWRDYLSELHFQLPRR